MLILGLGIKTYFKKGTSNSLRSYLNLMFSQPLNSNDKSLVIVLKDLWLNEVKAGEKNETVFG